MLANHTSIRSLFKVLDNNYKLMRRRNAFLDQYKAFKLFENNFDELDEAAESVTKLIEEYEAAEKEDYISWGAQEDAKDGGAGDGGMDY